LLTTAKSYEHPLVSVCVTLQVSWLADVLYEHVVISFAKSAFPTTLTAVDADAAFLQSNVPTPDPGVVGLDVPPLHEMVASEPTTMTPIAFSVERIQNLLFTSELPAL